MSQFFMELATVIGGVIGSMLGFIVIALVGVFLVVPYVMMIRRAPKQPTRREPLGPVEDPRY